MRTGWDLMDEIGVPGLDWMRVSPEGETLGRMGWGEKYRHSSCGGGAEQ